MAVEVDMVVEEVRLVDGIEIVFCAYHMSLFFISRSGSHICMPIFI